MKAHELIPVALCSAVAWEQMEGNAKAPIEVVNAQSDDQNHRSSDHPLKKRH